MKKYLATLILITSAILLQAQQVVRIDNPSPDLSEQFKMAFSKEGGNDFWIGYSIERNSDREIMVGSFYDDNYGAVTLRDIILNNQKAIDYFSHYSKTKKEKYSGRLFRMINGTSINDKESQDGETAILFRYDKDSKSINDFREIDIASMSCTFDLWGIPLVWLGKQDNKMSVDFLFGFYNKLNNADAKKKLIAAIGAHTDQYSVTTFLKNIILSEADTELRKDVGFWLGIQNNSEALSTLTQVVNEDLVLEVRKNAVWGIGYIKLPGSLDELITIAKHNGEKEIRRDAIYAIGNKAVKKAEDALKDFIDNDPDVEIKKTAVYALANSSKDAVPLLIKIAKTNTSLEVRKSAIYSLGNSDDKRALDALIELAKR